MILIQPIQFNNSIFKYSGIIYYSFLETFKILNIENNFFDEKFCQIFKILKICTKEISCLLNKFKKIRNSIVAENTYFPYFKNFGFSKIKKYEMVGNN